MEASAVALSPGDILRGCVDHIDAALDVCFLDVGPYGTVLIPLAGIASVTLARIVPGACLCAQVIAPRRGKTLPRATPIIEFTGRTSVIMFDGTAVMAEPRIPAQAHAHVSREIAGVLRADLASRLEASFMSPSTGLDAMLGAVCGHVDVVLRAAANDVPWEQVLSSVVVQMTEAAAFTVLARADRAPALLMSEKPDADGDADARLVSPFTAPETMLDGRRMGLAGGGEIVFERTEALWSVAVLMPRNADGDSIDCIERTNIEAAQAIAEALTEYDLNGLVVCSFVPGLSMIAFSEVVDQLASAAGSEDAQISSDALLSLVMIARKKRILLS